MLPWGAPRVAKRPPAASWRSDSRLTERLTERVLCLPTGTAVDVADIEQIGQIIRLAAKHGAEIRSALAEKKDGAV